MSNKKTINCSFILDSQEKCKILIGGIVLFLIVSSYSLNQELKYVVFSSIVGSDYIPFAKLLSVVFIIFVLLIDGMLVASFRRHQLIVIYNAVFGIIGITLSYFLIDTNVGIKNFVPNLNRWYGWIFFIYIEAFSPFLLSIFWSFMNAIHTPENAQKTYGIIVGLSKLGGMIFIILAILLLKVDFIGLNDEDKLIIIFVVSSLLLVICALYLYHVLKRFRHSVFFDFYSPSNKVEAKTGAIAGIKILFKNRYVLGIFFVVFFGDVLSEILNYKRILFVMNESDGLSDKLINTYKQSFCLQCLGFFISIFFTTFLMRKCGIAKCIFILPILTLMFFFFYINFRNDKLLVWLYILSKAIHYTLGVPIREGLYIVADKNVQFKAKFVIDTLGIKLARNIGQSINVFATYIYHTYGVLAHSLFINFFFLTVPILWLIATYFVSTKYQFYISNRSSS